MSNQVGNVEAAVERRYALNVGTIGSAASRHERPHKPVLLLTVLDLIAVGRAAPERIDWSKELREEFKDYFTKVQSLNDSCTPENPFLYLRGDGFWQPVTAAEESGFSRIAFSRSALR